MTIARQAPTADRDRGAGVIDVSFIVAAFNAEPFIGAAVHSALAQQDVGVEVIVVDDASTDGTADAVAALAETDGRIRLLRRAGTGGPSIARNAAMAAARGRWMAILDADDLVAPDRSRRLLDLATAASADVIADNFERFQVEDQPAGSTMIATAAEPYAFTVDVASFLRGNVMFGSGANLGYVKPMFRADFMRAKELRHEEDILIGEDYHLCLACLIAGARFVVTSESFYRYRTRAGSLSWRLGRPHIEKLLASHARLDLEHRYANDAAVLAAASSYVHALERAARLTDVIDNAKRGRWLTAAGAALSHPQTWPLALRFGSGAAAKRLGLAR